MDQIPELFENFGNSGHSRNVSVFKRRKTLCESEVNDCKISESEPPQITIESNLTCTESFEMIRNPAKVCLFELFFF